MALPLPEVASALHRLRHSLDHLFAQNDELGLLPTRIAEQLIGTRTGAPLGLCHLPRLGAAAVDETGSPRPDWLGVLLAAEPLQRADGSPFPERTLPLPATIGLAATYLLIEPVVIDSAFRGLLGLALQRGATVESVAAMRLILACAARQIGWLLERQQLRAKQNQIAAHLRAATLLGDGSELASPLHHEFNNFLNHLMLQLALLQKQLPSEHFADLELLRRRARALANVIAELQGIPRERDVEQELDLNAVLKATIEHIESNPPLGSRLTLELAPDLPSVVGAAPDLERLCRFALAIRFPRSAPQDSCTVKTTHSLQGVAVSFIEKTRKGATDDARASIGLVPHFGLNHLRLMACRTLAQRLHGKLHALELPDGYELRLDFPTGSPA